MQYDLFHQLVYEDNGYKAVRIVDDEPFPSVHVYTPDGEWCGCTNASNYYSWTSAVREIIKYNRQWQQQNKCTNYIPWVNTSVGVIVNACIKNGRQHVQRCKCKGNKQQCISSTY